MKSVALILNWCGLACCLPAFLLSLILSHKLADVTFIVPFAASLATFYFHPKAWFVGVTLAVNALMACAIVVFVAFMLIHDDDLLVSGPVLPWVLFIGFLSVFLFNLFALWPYLSTRHAG